MKIKEHITAGCFLVRKKNDDWEIILIYRKWAEDNQGWVPPKGHVEKGETLYDTAIRETTEETGYKNIEIIDTLEPLHIEYPWDDGYIHKKTIHYFLAQLLDNQRIDVNLSNQEETSTIETKWFTLKEAEKKLKFDDEREILRKVIDILKI